MGGNSAQRTRRLGFVIALNLVLVVLQVLAGLHARSSGLIADAGHNVVDIAGIALSLGAVRWALRPPTAHHSFGWHRTTILAALVNGGVVAAATAGIAVLAVHRLLRPVAVEGNWVVATALVAVVVNGSAALLLRRDRGDLNMRASLLHMAGDALSSLAVLVAGAIILARPSLRWADPAASLVVAGAIIIEAAVVLRSSLDVLLESAPQGMDLDLLSSTMNDVYEVSEVHDLHVWSLSSELHALSAHLVLRGQPTLEEAHAVGERVKELLAARFGIAHATVELESESCQDGYGNPCVIDVEGTIRR